MAKKLKLKLDELVSRFFIYEHCDKKQYVQNDELDDNTVIVCAICDLPMIMKDSLDEWYYVKDKVF